MLKTLVFLAIFIIVSCLKLANQASIWPNQSEHLIQASSNGGRVTYKPIIDQSPTSLPSIDMPQGPTNPTNPTVQTTTSSPTTFDPNSDPDDNGSQAQVPPPPNSPDRDNATTQTTGDTNQPNDQKEPKPPAKTSADNTTSQPPSSSDKTTLELQYSSTELPVLVYSIFIVYVSFVKLLYHNVHFIKHNLTEPGILMVFGIIWQLVSRQITTDLDTLPRFNSRIFFYLFLPSTVLESASLLSNKWLFFNLLPILTHSIIGTVLYSSAMGFTIYSLAHSNIFTSGWIDEASPVRASPPGSTILERALLNQEALYSYSSLENQSQSLDIQSRQLDIEPAYEFRNLTLADCLIFGTILSSIDSTPMLTVFKQYQVNEKLYYLVLGENLMNNAVVIMIFNLLVDFFETTRLTVFRIYVAILQFFANLIGAIFIGIAIALFALLSVRLTKRLQVSQHALSNYQNQCQAMVETLMVLKLAYLTYTLANLAGTSSIVSLATFGILNDQYIKQNLNLRSQLAFRQVTLAMKTMGFSLVYPLLGMLLIDTALSNPNQQQQQQQAANYNPKIKLESANLVMDVKDVESGWQFHLMNSSMIFAPSSESQDFSALKSSTSAATKKLTTLASQANLHWNFKFLSIVVILTIVYRFLIVIALGLVGNVLTCGQIKIKFKEQMIMAYAGFKGPLSIALVHSLIEHNDHRDRIGNNRHLFKYTILFNIFISAVLGGCFIRPLVARIQSTLIGHLSTSLDETTNESTIVFESINYKLSENVSHGINSILGHTRSPYDKFIDFNETHIKRWLVRGGTSNTNWLSVFYDNLILDETLNANCFHIATEDPTTMRIFRNRQRQKQREKTQQTISHRRRSSISFLDPISEHETVAKIGSRDVSGQSRVSSMEKLRDYRSRKTTRRGKIRPDHKGQPRLLAPEVKHALANRVAPVKQVSHEQSQGDDEVLREFVMLNLKLEEGKRRRQGQAQRRADKSLNLMGLSTSEAESNARERGPQTATHIDMIDSSTSGDDFKLNSGSIERRHKQTLLSSLTARLNDTQDSTSRTGAGQSEFRQQPARVQVVSLAGLSNKPAKHLNVGPLSTGETQIAAFAHKPTEADGCLQLSQARHLTATRSRPR